MGGRGSKSPQAKRHVANISHRALLWAKSKIGITGYGRWDWKGIFYPGTAKCNLFVERAFNQGNPEEKPFPFTPSRSYLNTGIGRMRQYSAADIYSGRLLIFKLVKNLSLVTLLRMANTSELFLEKGRQYLHP